jgi:hypothetical protein
MAELFAGIGLSGNIFAGISLTDSIKKSGNCQILPTLLQLIIELSLQLS